MRAHLLILSNKGYHVNQLAEMFFITRQTISNLIDGWEEIGIAALYDAQKDGRPLVLNSEDEDFIKDFVKGNPVLLKKSRLPWPRIEAKRSANLP